MGKVPQNHLEILTRFRNKKNLAFVSGHRKCQNMRLYADFDCVTLKSYCNLSVVLITGTILHDIL